jgi:hypothetical protein
MPRIVRQATRKKRSDAAGENDLDIAFPHIRSVVDEIDRHFDFRQSSRIIHNQCDRN